MAQKKKNSTQTAQTSLSVVESPRPIWQERSLARLSPFGVSRPNNSKRKAPLVRTVHYVFTDNGLTTKATAIYRGAPGLGLPTEKDQDKWFAFLEIADERRRKSGADQLPSIVKFSGGELIKKLGLVKGGHVYDEILRWGLRLSALTIESKRAIYLSSQKIYSNDSFHIFQSFRQTGVINAETGERQEMFEAELAPWVIENLKGRFSIPLNFAPYRKLRKGIAKSLYPLLHYWFAATKGEEVQKDYLQFCALLDIQPRPFKAEIRRVLSPAFEELMEIGYISKWIVDDRKSLDGFKVIMFPGEAILAAAKKSEKSKDLSAPAAASEISSPELTDEQVDVCRMLLAHNVAKGAAHKLARTLAPTKIIEAVEYTERVSAERHGTANPIKNPAGFLVDFLKQGQEPPAHFVSSIKRRQFEQRQNEERAQFEERQNAEVEYAGWVQEQVDRKMDELFTPESLIARAKIVVAEMLKNDPKARFWTPEARQNSAFHAIRKEVRTDLNLPTFEQWSENIRDKQVPLFSE